MAELKWEELPEKQTWKLTSPHHVRSLADVWRGLGGVWLSGDLFSSFPDAESAMRAVEVELIRRWRAELAALEKLHAKGLTAPRS